MRAATYSEHAYHWTALAEYRDEQFAADCAGGACRWRELRGEEGRTHSAPAEHKPHADIM